MNILKTHLAPITDEAWKLIQREAERTLKSNLSARKVVDVVGPKGFDFSAVAEGRLDVSKQGPEGVSYGIRRNFPIVELRAAFELDLWELDNSDRGARDPDLTELILAAKSIAGFEETAVYKGFAPGKITGMAEAAKKNGTISIGKDVSKYLDAVIQARMKLEDQEVEGPYGLVLGPDPYRILYGSETGYPVWKQVEQLVGDKVQMSPFIEGGFLVSKRGGDLELVLGQDFSIGFEASELKKVRLYFTESFTFRVLNPKVIVELKFGK